MRDGGYVNDWAFGHDRIVGVIDGLTQSGVDIVECGFLQDKARKEDQALFNNISEIENMLPLNSGNIKYVAMINCGEFDVSKLPPKKESKLFGLRIAFHEHQSDIALSECKAIQEKGYEVFFQPMGTDAYEDKSLLELIEKVNHLKPYAFYFVDSLGVMNESDIERFARLIHIFLEEKIVLGFHSHNNLQLAFSNAQKLVSLSLKRDLIIDSTVFGMGRGAGNLHTELIANYLNESDDASYDVDKILRVYDENIHILRKEFAWGYSLPYYLAAVHKCHPNYGTYLINRSTLPITDMGMLLSQVPMQHKRLYDESIINDLYVELIAYRTDDDESYKHLKNQLADHTILLLGPGKSLITHSNVINKYIKANNPKIISVNHVLEMYHTDFMFFSNRKRFEEHKKVDGSYILTSNIKPHNEKALVFDYISLCNQQGKYADNALLIILSLLERLETKSVDIAGFDGYIGDDYYREDLQNITDNDWIQGTNIAVTSGIKRYSEKIKISSITPSVYIK